MNKIVAWVRLIIFVYLLDRWIFAPIVEASKHKGPWIVVKEPRKPRASKSRRKKNMSNPVKKAWNMKLVAGITVGAMLFIGVIVLVVMAIYNRLNPGNPVVKAVEGTSTDTSAAA